MRAEDLMIGDILDYMGTAVKVYSIGAKICVKECFGKNTYIVDFDNLLKGLELTPEILEKNGFGLQSDNTGLGTLVTYWLGSELGAFRIHNLNNDWWQFGLAKIRNVHELQHAMRLCGIEKEVVL